MTQLKPMKTELDNGGSAFPSASNNDLGATDSPGMSLRDYFAAKAMAAFIVSPHFTSEVYDDDEVIAKWAYSVADGMLKERAK